MKKKPYISLKAKLSISIVVMCFMIGFLAILLMMRIAKDIVDSEYTSKAEQVSKAVVHTLNVGDVRILTDKVMKTYRQVDEIVPSTEWGTDAWNEYMSHYEGIDNLPVYVQLRNYLRVYQDIFGVDCIYIMNFNVEARHAIYIIDSAYVDYCPPGVVDSFESGLWPDPVDGTLPTTLTNEKVYGALVTAGSPIKYKGETIAYLCVDISMNDIKAREQEHVFTTALLMVALAAFVLVVSLLYFTRTVVKPVALLSYTAKNYSNEENGMVHHSFEALSVTNHDEISDLLTSMKKMEADMNAQVTALLDAKVVIKETEEKASTLEALATKDSLTGIGNRRSYEEEAKKLNAEVEGGFRTFGIAMIDLNYLKVLNDTYGHESGDLAIKMLSNVTCDVFKRSKVFRVGGDEFVVLLKNKDYVSAEARIKEFNERISSLQEDEWREPWEKISAALGYAAFDEKIDKTVDDVFQRADKAMYDRKAAMKAERNR